MSADSQITQIKRQKEAKSDGRAAGRRRHLLFIPKARSKRKALLFRWHAFVSPLPQDLLGERIPQNLILRFEPMNQIVVRGAWRDEARQLPASPPPI